MLNGQHASPASFSGYIARPFGLRALLESEEKGDGAAPGSAAAPPEPKPAADDVSALKARLADFEQRETQRAADETKRTEELKKKAQADGDIKTQLELQTKEIEKLRGLQADAELGRSYRERETKRIEAAIAKLTPEQAEFVSKQPNVELQARAIDLLTASTTKADDGEKPPAKPPVLGAAAPGGSVDFRAAWEGGADSWAKAKERDPKGAASFRHSLMNHNAAHQPLAALRRGPIEKH